MAQRTPLDDATIIHQVRDGEVEQYGELMQRYEDKLLRYVTYLLRDSAAASDVVQDTFIKAYRNLQGFNDNYAFSSWIYRIAHNEAMNAIKKNSRLTPLEDESHPQLSYHPRTDLKLDSLRLTKDVQQCLGQLEPKYREIIQLVYFEDMKYAEVGDILHIPTSTVGVRLSRAKAKLRIICEQKGVRHER
jgi:RNA polymerase sigma-70 factor (ECF subfamily)